MSNIENLRNILNKSENNVLASNSKTEGKGKSKTFVNLTQSNIEDIIPNTSPENKRDVFDLVAELSDNEFTLNRKKTDKTYARKKQVKEKDEMIYQKLTNFEDDAYRLKIIDWLCDSKNKFNRLTQTQSIIDDDSSIASSLDMPSISQTIETASTKPKYVSSSKKRTRSLDVKVKNKCIL